MIFNKLDKFLVLFFTCIIHSLTNLEFFPGQIIKCFLELNGHLFHLTSLRLDLFFVGYAISLKLFTIFLRFFELLFCLSQLLFHLL